MGQNEDPLDLTPAARREFVAKLRERNLREFTVTIVVDPQAQDDPDLRYQLARAKHEGERIGLVVGGFNYDVGLQLVQIGSVEVAAPSAAAAAEARAEAAERKVADAWDAGFQYADHVPTGRREDNPYRATLDTAAEEQA